MKPPLITVLGPTATGKTKFAVRLAYELNTEIISADSRQVYKMMDIGTGKDLEDFVYKNVEIPYHIIDIANAGEQYSVFDYKHDFEIAYKKIVEKGKIPILCGGSGMYLEAILRNFDMPKLDDNNQIVSELQTHTNEQLITELKSLKKLHNTTDTTDRQRLIKAVAIAKLEEENQTKGVNNPFYPSPVFGIFFEREEIRKRITYRLEQRLKEGMIEEVENILETGVTVEQLRYYGLEYKFVCDYISGVYNFEEMKNKLNTAIHQFAKRQMTWFRRMEKNNIKIHWLDGNKDIESNMNEALSIVNAKI